MSAKVLSASLVATALAGSLALTGHAQAQQPPAQQPSIQASAAAVTLVGCVAKESDVLKKAVAVPGNPGMGDEFVLIQAAVKSADATPEPSGTPASPSGFGKVYRVTGEKEADLKNYVGQRVEISGAIKASDAAPSATGTSGSMTPAEPTVDNTPEFTATTITPATGSCAPLVK